MTVKLTTEQLAKVQSLKKEAFREGRENAMSWSASVGLAAGSILTIPELEAEFQKKISKEHLPPDVKKEVFSEIRRGSEKGQIKRLSTGRLFIPMTEAEAELDP